MNDVKVPWIPPSPRPYINSPKSQNMSPMSLRTRPMSPRTQPMSPRTRPVSPRKSLSCDGSVMSLIREPPTTPVRPTAATPRCKPKQPMGNISTPVKSCRKEKLGKYKTISTEPRSKADLVPATPLAEESNVKSKAKHTGKSIATPRSKGNLTNTGPPLPDENTDPTQRTMSPKIGKSSAAKLGNNANMGKQPTSKLNVAKQPAIRNAASRDVGSKLGARKDTVSKPVIGKELNTKSAPRPSSVLKSNLSSRADLKTVAEKKRPVLGSLENRLGNPSTQIEKSSNATKSLKSNITGNKTEHRPASPKPDGNTSNDPKSTIEVKAGKPVRSGIPAKSGIPGPRGRTAGPSKLPTRSRIPSVTRTRK